jgi:hypothetical protein
MTFSLLYLNTSLNLMYLVLVIRQKSSNLVPSFFSIFYVLGFPEKTRISSA